MFYCYYYCWIYILVINDIQCSIFLSFIIDICLLIDIIIILIVQFYCFIIVVIQVVSFYFKLIVIIWCYIILITLLLISFSIVIRLNYFKFVLKVSIHSPIIKQIYQSISSIRFINNCISSDWIIHGYVFVLICTWSIFFY